ESFRADLRRGPAASPSMKKVGPGGSCDARHMGVLVRTLRRPQLCTMSIPPALSRCLPDRSGGRGVAMMVLVGILALAGAAFGQGRDVHPDLRESGCGAVLVSSLAQPRAAGRFSARKTVDLTFRMRLASTDEDAHLVSFRVFTPRGHLYQELQAVHRAGSARRVSSLRAELAVAGTAIATSSLYGRWRVVPYLDDSPEPCAAGAVFTVVQ